MSCYRETRIDGMEFDPDIPHGLPLVVDDMTLAFTLGIRDRTLWWLVWNKKKLYEVFKLPKRGKTGRYRDIQNPADRLKSVQQGIMARFLSPIPMGAHVGAYVLGRSCRNTAEQHVGKAVIISLDIKDFFPSVRRAMIRRFLHEELRYNHHVSSLLADLLTYTTPQDLDKKTRSASFVPQGAPSSGAICNLIADFLFDHKIMDALKEVDPGWVYTRYSDDIDISHPEIQEPDTLVAIVGMVGDILQRQGFVLNMDKTKIEPRWKRQKVLGMVVNKKVNIPRFEYMRLKSIIHNCLVNGFASQFERAGKPSMGALKYHLRGKLAFFQQIDKSKALRLKDQFELACEMHKEEDDEHEVRFDKE